MKKKFVDEYHWIEEEEMLDLVAIAQSAPGAIAVNGAIVIGYKLAGIAGILTAIAGTVIPPFLIISILSVGYQTFRNNQIISLSKRLTRKSSTIFYLVFSLAFFLVVLPYILSSYIMIMRIA